MAKPNLIITERLGEIVTKGTCPICRVTFAHGGKVGEDSKNQIPDMYTAHLKEKHPEILREDASQAAARIVREATEQK